MSSDGGLGPTADGPDAICITDLQHCYKTVVALDGVSLTIPAGSDTAIIGPNGVGKSTLLGLVAGTRIIQAGQFDVLGVIWPMPTIARTWLPESPSCPKAWARTSTRASRSPRPSTSSPACTRHQPWNEAPSGRIC
jgi:energy-coupling factor transporter ATP-binding protein EcfA2